MISSTVEQVLEASQLVSKLFLMQADNNSESRSNFFSQFSLRQGLPSSTIYAISYSMNWVPLGNNFRIAIARGISTDYVITINLHLTPIISFFHSSPKRGLLTTTSHILLKEFINLLKFYRRAFFFLGRGRPSVDRFKKVSVTSNWLRYWDISVAHEAYHINKNRWGIYSITSL